MSEQDKKRMEEIDNRSRETASQVEKLFEGFNELLQASGETQMAIQQLHIQLLTQQIMNEVIPRYLAGYNVGDYTKEVESAQNDNVQDPSEFKMIVNDPNFNQERFQGLCKEIAQVMIDLRMKAVRAANQNAGPKPQIIAPPQRRIQIAKP
jgi:coenzyme F420-reducing hydrogenase alpha subunit